MIINGFYDEAINEFLTCLQANDMLMNKLAELYNKLGETNKALLYENMAKEKLSKLWDRKIVEEIKKYYNSDQS